MAENASLATSSNLNLPTTGLRPRQLMGTLNPSIPLSFEGNTSLWFSASQLAGKLNDLIGVSYRLDRSARGRALLFYATLHANWAALYYSHELAHRQIYGYYDLDQRYEVDGTDWTQLVPKLRHQSEDQNDSVSDSLGLKMLGRIHGLVQQKLNARFQFQHNVTSPSFGFDEGVAYFLNTTAEPWYLLAEAADLHRDLEDVPRHLNAPNNQLTRKKWLAASLSASAASPHVWESLYASYRYLRFGERGQKPWQLRFGDGAIAMASPAFQTMPMPHPGGLYLEALLPIHNLLRGGEWCFLNLGSDIHNDEGQRVGLEVTHWNPLPFKQHYIPRFHLGAFRTFSQNEDRSDGYSLQGGLSFGITRRILVAGTIKHSDNDILENRILGKGSFEKGLLPRTTEGFIGLSFGI